MLHRLLARPLARSAAASAAGSACKACVCSCGRRFTPATIPSAPPPVQRRGKKSIAHAHPEVYREKRHSTRKRAVTAEERKERQLEEDSQRQWHRDNLERAVRLRQIECSQERALEFLNEFAELASKTGYRQPGASPVDPRQLAGLIQRNAEYDEAAGRFVGEKEEIGEDDLNYLAHMLLVSPAADHKLYGRKLLFALSHLGSETATMRIAKQMLVEARLKPAKLRASEVRRMREHLAEIAAKGENYRAMVLEGKIEYMLGNENAAMKLWTDATEVAIAHDAKLAQLSGTERDAEEKKMKGSEHADLETPWIELSNLHYKRQEWAKMKWAVKIGCEQDDPTSHYFAALLERQTGASGDPITTSAWLYHMTKAAATAHPKAAHELAYFYAYSIWPYIEDEPPDHLKPTPFDKYPPVHARPAASFLDTMRELLGWKAKTQGHPSESLFKDATFPSDPAGRLRLAFDWLDVARACGYAPACLLAARLYLEKTMYTSAAAPKAALELQDERYTYASKEDYDAGNPISKDTDASAEAEEDQLANPFYSPDAAYTNIQSLFQVRTALVVRAEVQELLDHARKAGRSIDEQEAEEEMLTESRIEYASQMFAGRQSVPPEVRQWLRFPETREMFSRPGGGGPGSPERIVDDTGGAEEDCVEAAKAICEEMGWDVFDHRGGLVYRHGMVGPGQRQKARAAG